MSECRHANVRIRELEDGHAIVCDDCSVTVSRYVYGKGTLTDQFAGYGDWLGADEFNALRTGAADPAAQLGPKDKHGRTAIEREFVGGRLHTACSQLTGNLVDDVWKVRYIQDVTHLLKVILSTRASDAIVER